MGVPQMAPINQISPIHGRKQADQDMPSLNLVGHSSLQATVQASHQAMENKKAHEEEKKLEQIDDMINNMDMSQYFQDNLDKIQDNSLESSMFKVEEMQKDNERLIQE